MAARVLTATLCLLVLDAAGVLGDRAKPADNAPPSAVKRLGLTVKALDSQVALDKPIVDQPLKDVLEILEDLANPPEAQRKPDLKVVRILFDDATFRKLKGKDFDGGNQTVTLPRLNGERLEAVLQVLCKQVDATYAVRDGRIEITTFEKIVGRQPRQGESPFLVNHLAVEQPLKEAIDLLVARHGRSVVLPLELGEQARTLLSARLVNVPFDTAVEILAEMAKLKAVSKDSALLVTTPEHAKALLTQGKGSLRPWSSPSELKTTKPTP